MASMVTAIILFCRRFSPIWITCFVLDIPPEAKEATDSFVAKNNSAMYHDKVMPRSTALVIAHVVNAI